MSYEMQAGEVYRLARSLRHEDVFSFPPGVFKPEIVQVDQETANEMEFAGVLLYLDNQCVAVFTHPTDASFVLGMVVEPTEEWLEPVDEVKALGYEPDDVCECGYYFKDHTVDAGQLYCPDPGTSGEDAGSVGDGEAEVSPDNSESSAESDVSEEVSDSSVS